MTDNNSSNTNNSDNNNSDSNTVAPSRQEQFKLIVSDYQETDANLTAARNEVSRLESLRSDKVKAISVFLGPKAKSFMLNGREISVVESKLGVFFLRGKKGDLLEV